MIEDCNWRLWTDPDSSIYEDQMELDNFHMNGTYIPMQIVMYINTPLFLILGQKSQSRGSTF